MDTKSIYVQAFLIILLKICLPHPHQYYGRSSNAKLAFSSLYYRAPSL